jgi:hypothetical protein
VILSLDSCTCNSWKAIDGPLEPQGKSVITRVSNASACRNIYTVNDDGVSTDISGSMMLHKFHKSV